MIRRPPRSTPLYSSAASDVYKRQVLSLFERNCFNTEAIANKTCKSLCISMTRIDQLWVATVNKGHKVLIISMAVSYTHLRAHETGRNLVCRLLLEKKKKKK